MNIWVDADSCPVVIKDILYRAAHRAQIPMTLLANHALTTPPSPYIKTQTVSSGFDVADDEIVKQVVEGDLIITSDIPLADEVVEKGAKALSPRGELFTKANIKARLNIRDFMDTMRASGIHSQGQAPMNQTDRQNFANHLDTIIRASVAKKAKASIKKIEGK